MPGTENPVISKTNTFLNLIIINKYDDYMKGKTPRLPRGFIVEENQ